jgi:hypothetical protein
MVPVFAHPVLATPMRAFVPDTLPVWQTRHCGSSYFDYRLVYLKLTTTTTANTTAKFLWLNDDIDHDNINLIDFIYGDYITNGIIDHDYNALTPSYIDIGNKSYHLTSGLCSSQTVRVTTRFLSLQVWYYYINSPIGSL